MAKSQNLKDRVYIAAKKYSHEILLGYKPKALKGRVLGPKVVMNSLPKSGTNLLNRVMLYMPLMRKKGFRTTRLWGEADSKILKKIKNIKNGQYIVGHIQDSRDIFDIMKNEDIKGLLMIRDPRKIIISHYNYVTSIDKTHKTHKYFASLNSDEERIGAIIEGVDDIVASIDEVLERYKGWMDNEQVYIVRFEDLVGPNGGGSKEVQYQTVQKIANHLNIEINSDELISIADKIFYSKTPTFRSAQISGWDKEYSEKQKDILKRKIGDWLIEYGYEKDMNW